MKRTKKFRPGDRIIVTEDVFAMFDVGHKGKVWRVIDDGKKYLYQLTMEKDGKWFFPIINGEGVELCQKEKKNETIKQD